MNEIMLPIEHLSYSAMRSFCSNPLLFKKNYLLGIYDNKQSPSMMVGKAFHKYAECLYKGISIDAAKQKAYELIDQINDTNVDWGKTGSREKVVKELNQAIEFFMMERKDYGVVKSAEYKRVVQPVIEGEMLPLPIKAITDLVTEKEEKLYIKDWKVVASFTDDQEEQPDYILQAIFNFFTVLDGFKKEPESMTFIEIKKSANKNGEPQIHEYEIVFNKHPEYFRYFARMYTGIIQALSQEDYIFLPNFSDLMTKKEAWDDFTKEIMDFSLPKQISHQSAEKKNVERSFVESTLNTEEALNLSAEQKIIKKMLEFGVPLEYVEAYPGASVTMYAFKPSRGVKMTTIEKFDKDLQLALAVKSVRILAPIPGKTFIGIEIPNETQKIIPIPDVLPKHSLDLPVGIDIHGAAHTVDLAKAPHLLVAGATGSGKSVSLAVFISTLIKNNTTADLGMVLIDPKRSEFVDFEDDQHLLSEIITDSEDVVATLSWAVDEMEQRYLLLKQRKTRNIDAYNANGGSMQRIVIIIDELADLILSEHGSTIEKCLVRLAQKSRAIGIHLIVATQRPSVDVVTGILKANFPVRLAFMTATQVDSKVILDQNGAEKLIGNGDCLLMQPQKDLQRLQGYFI